MAVEKSVVRSVRFSPEEWGRVEAWARDAQVSPSRYVREATMRRRPAERPRGVRAEAVREMKAVGRNLNQLVRLAHRARADRAAGRGADPALGGAGGTVTPEEVAACLANVLAAMDRVSPPRSEGDAFIASDMEPDHPDRVAASGTAAGRGRADRGAP
ncbi:plasmid mobilization protein [Rubrivirga litoralis]|uniref:Mobilisation protein (MobC) n=1 Tax=Rubrivirga litoralis TaxID=3075598 RepID=A0ABU3BV74_9BACT|nr:hypothetical protein [Rubrivirga sp. F394]MDT0633196.1 hypothetical protein [Rubrivirga sp. F394]